MRPRPATSFAKISDRCRWWRVLAATALYIGIAAPAGGVWAQQLIVIDNPSDKPWLGSAYTHLDGFAASDGMALLDFIEQPWPNSPQHRDGSALTLVQGRTAVGTRLGPLWFDYVYRREWWFDDRASSLRYLQASQLGTLGPAQTLPLDYRFEGFDADAMRFTFADRFSLRQKRDVSLGIALNLLRIHQLRFERGNGSYSSNGVTQGITGQRELWQTGLATGNGPGDFNPSSPASTPAFGYGYGLDLGLRYEFGATGAVRLAINDLGGELHWGEVPHRNETYTGQLTAAQSIDRYDSFAQKLPVKTLLGVDYPMSNRWQLHTDFYGYRGESFTNLGSTYRFGPEFRLRGDYEPRFATLGISLLWSQVTFGIRLDRLDKGNVKAGGGSLEINWAM